MSQPRTSRRGDGPSAGAPVYGPKSILAGVKGATLDAHRPREEEDESKSASEICDAPA